MTQYLYKIYDSTGATILGLLDPKAISSEVRFSHSINAGQGELTIKLKADFDDFGEGVTITHGNIVRVYQIDDTNPKGRLIYAGHISRYTPYIGENEEGLEITLLGLGTLLQHAFYKDVAAFQKTHTAADVAVVFKAVVDHFNTIYAGALVGYDGSSIDTTANPLTYTFDKLTHRESLRKAFDFAPADWYWRIDADGKVYLKAKPVAPTHAFTIGLDVRQARVVKSAESVVNGYLLTAGTTPVENYYEDATSKTAYGTRELPEEDLRITDTATADARGNALVTERKDPKNSTILTIGAPYDLASIRPGDTCKIRNIKKGSLLFTGNMQIVRVDYTPDEVRLTLAEEPENFHNAIKSISNSN